MTSITSKQERLGYIVCQLLQAQEVTVADIMRRFRASERTARADLTEINELRTRRFRGGIASANLFYDVQRLKNRDAKDAVALEAAKYFSTGVSIAASPGTTVARTYGQLIENGIAAPVVTNSVGITEHVGPSTVYMVGGEYIANIHALAGSDAVKGFEQRNPCRHGLLGASGITVTADGDIRLFVQHDPEVTVIRKMLEVVTERLVIVATVHKLGRGDPWQVGSINELTQTIASVVLVTNHPPDWADEMDKEDYQRAEESYRGLKSLAAKNKRFEVVGARRIDARNEPHSNKARKARKKP